jgi:putative FmdB family regulatory protein
MSFTNRITSSCTPTSQRNWYKSSPSGCWDAPGALYAGPPVVCFPNRPRAMPNYDYHCEKCDKTFEFFQSMKDDALRVCPKEACIRKPWGKGKVTRQIGTGAGLIFKGSGFYITDYRSESYKTAAKSDSAPPAAESSSAPASPSTSANPATPAPPPKATPPPAPAPAKKGGKSEA